MRHVGIREFKNQATTILSAGETLVVERHGKPIGFFVPLEAKDRAAGKKTLSKLDRHIERLLERLGIDEEELANEIGRVGHAR